MNDIGKGKNYPPEEPNFIEQAACYGLLNFLVIPSIGLFMNILNRTRVIGRQNLAGLRPPWILMSNHLTLLDDLFIGPIIFFPKVLLGYQYLPYHAPEERNFYKHPIISWFMRRSKAIPLIRGHGLYQEGVNRLIRAVKSGGILHIYPEGTRTRSGEIGDGKSGIGRIVYESGAPVVPVYHQGLEDVLPIGEGVPRIAREIRIAIGKPLRFDEDRKLDNDASTWKRITGRIMDAIREQRTAANARWGFRPIRTRFKEFMQNKYQNNA